MKAQPAIARALSTSSFVLAGAAQTTVAVLKAAGENLTPRT